METSVWDDDQALLGEALAVFADWRDDGYVDATPAAVRPVKINRSRERQKEEMRQLQAAVASLEEELERLRTKREKRPRMESSALTAVSGSSLAIKAWETAARRQFHARRKAEAVNKRLRDMLETQTRVADDLIRVLQRAEAARQEAHRTALFPVHDAMLMLSDAASDERMGYRLTQMSMQRHPFAQCAKFSAGSPQRFFFETTVLRDDEIESVLEIRAAGIFPLPPDRMVSELWSYFATLNCFEEDFSLATDLRHTNDHIHGNLRATVTADDVVGVLDARVWKQRYRNENDERMITSTTCGRPGLRNARTLELEEVDAIVTEDSWLRILDANDAASSFSWIQNVRRARIQFCGSDGPDRKQVDAVKKFLARLAQNQLRWGSEVVERKLLLENAPNRVSVEVC